jgi:hypothetical protein
MSLILSQPVIKCPPCSTFLWDALPKIDMKENKEIHYIDKELYICVPGLLTHKALLCLLFFLSLCFTFLWDALPKRDIEENKEICTRIIFVSLGS